MGRGIATVLSMMTVRETTANRQKLERLNSLLSEMLSEGLQRDFYGTLSLEVAIQDGTIQHLRRRVEQLEK